MSKKYEDVIYACWLGKSIGGTLGLPVEGHPGPLKLTFYDPVPTVAPPNDDLELQLVWLHMVEQCDGTLTQESFAQAWLDHIHYMWDEYGRCRWNLRRGVPASLAGTFENSFHDGMGSPIRSEIWACLFPGDPDSAAHYAAMDASLDHGVEGIAGEVLFAVMQSLVASGEKLSRAIERALEYIPANSRTARAIQLARQQQQSGIPPWDCWKTLMTEFRSDNFTHAPLNVALTIWALLYGNGDFEKSLLLAVNAGCDTDCTTATVGATLGLMLGTAGIPEKWSKPIGTGVYIGPGIQGIDAPNTLEELTQRTVKLHGKLKQARWDPSWMKIVPESLDLTRLPGTIYLQPLHSDQQIPWANGELPAEVKKAGGATWTWECNTQEPRLLVCLARHGARLYMDGVQTHDYGADLLYVPATHRSGPSSRHMIDNPQQGRHTFRLELNSKAEDQEATVLLAYVNRHIAPWTSSELPHMAKL